MKHIAIVWMFAAALAAQQGKAQQAKDPKLELAAIIAVEEQERDLAKAEKLYRAAITDTKLSEAARTQANLRLGNLLQRLDRAAEAKPFLDAAAKAGEVGFDDFGAKPQGQDVERQKVLREKARELVNQSLLQQNGNWEPPLHGIGNSRTAEQLLWIGEAAVPEVVAALEKESATFPPDEERGGVTPHRAAVVGLAGFLWRTGGQASAAFLASCAQAERASFRSAIVSAAFQAEQPEMLAVAAKFLNDPDPTDDVLSSLLQSGPRTGGGRLEQRFEAKQIVDAGLRGPLRGKVRLLQWGARTSLAPAILARLHQLVREGLQSADPEFGNAANQFLLSTVSQSSIEGIELLLQELPKMKGSNNAPSSLPQPSPEVQARGSNKSRFTADEGARLLPALDACARALPASGDGRRTQWLDHLIWQVAQANDATPVPTFFAWIDLGYTGAWYALHDRVRPEHCKDLFARFDRFSPRDQEHMLSLLSKLALPADMFPLLRDKAEQLRAEWKADVRLFGNAMAQTGDPAVADWILAEAARNENDIDWIASPLVELGRKTQAENVRVALRKAALGGAKESESCCQALLALLSMGDVPALDIVVKKASFPSYSAWHPYSAKPEARRLTPVQYLVYQKPDPPHGFTDEQVIGVLQKIAANDVPQDWQPRSWSYTAIPDRLLGALATIVAAVPNIRHSDVQLARGNWISLVLERTRRGQGALQGWVAQMLQHEQAYVRQIVLEQLDESEVTRERALVEKCLDVDDDDCALSAAQALTKIATPIEPERLLQNKHAKVRLFAIESIPSRLGSAGEKLVLPLTKDPDDEVRKAAAGCLGALVSKDAVPALIEMLKDPNDQVRTRATDALTRIRFFHEQQAHWDRVLKGLDASPASAAEKLLLQAKPGAAKEQRLLAITSLGALGVPEALPFLIEWSSDADADIAAKAKAAITQIHLNPRK